MAIPWINIPAAMMLIIAPANLTPRLLLNNNAMLNGCRAMAVIIYAKLIHIDAITHVVGLSFISRPINAIAGGIKSVIHIAAKQNFAPRDRFCPTYSRITL